MLDLCRRYAVKQVAAINEFLLPGLWTFRNGRRALQLPVDLNLHFPKGSYLRSFVDRGNGWKRLDSSPVPHRIEGPGWWGDPAVFIRVPLRLLLRKAWRKFRLRGFVRQKTIPMPTLKRPRLKSRPRVSILIPTDGRTVQGIRGPVDLIAQCYRSIVNKSTYPNYEVLVAHNGRITPGIPAFKYDAPPGPFNLARKLNALIERAQGEYLVLLNDDTEVIAPGWIEALLEFATQPDVGAVGARLHYTDGRIQHAGVVFGLATLCGHVYMGHPYECPGASQPREYSAVTGACVMIRRGERLEEALPYTFDVDLCLRLRARGLRVVYTPYARLFHHESSTLKLGGASTFRELLRFRRRWPACLPDPFYVQDTVECVHKAKQP